LGAGDAVAGNAVEQMVDPWPPIAATRPSPSTVRKCRPRSNAYRTGKVIPPADPEDLESTNQSGQTINQTTVNAGAGASAPAATTTTAQ